MNASDREEITLRRYDIRLTILLVIATSIYVLMGFNPLIWKRDDERKQCLYNIDFVQMVMRGHCSVNGIAAGENRPYPRTILIGPGNYIEKEPICPSGGTYTWIEDRVPDVGELMIRCSCVDHVPPNDPDR